MYIGCQVVPRQGDRQICGLCSKAHPLICMRACDCAPLRPTLTLQETAPALEARSRGSDDTTASPSRLGVGGYPGVGCSLHFGSNPRSRKQGVGHVGQLYNERRQQRAPPSEFWSDG